MKKVNMITTLSPQKQYEIHRWFCMTIFLSLVMFIVGAYFIIPKLYSYISLKKEITLMRKKTSNYATDVSSKDALKKEYDELHARESKINSYKQQKKNPYSHIAAIVQICRDGVQLESVRFNKKEVEIAILCPTVEHAQMFIRQLSASQNFSRIKMMSLQHDGQTKLFRCTIKGNIIF